MSAAHSGTAVAPVREGLFTPLALIGGRCGSCGALQFPRRQVCPVCQHTDVAEEALPAEGRIYTFTIVRSRPPGYVGSVPYAYGVVELPVGLRVTTTLLADDLETIAIGGRVVYDTVTLAEGDRPVISFAYRLSEEDDQ